MTGAPCGLDGHRNKLDQRPPTPAPSSEQTLAQRREHPYLCATWLPRLPTGENSCEWAGWFNAHYHGWTRTPTEFDHAQWLMLHTELIHDQRSQWEDRGYAVSVEDQTAFGSKAHQHP